MKKCKKCAAIQSDERSTCIDCGTVLGRPMPEAEEELTEAALDDKLEGMSERTEDFYVPLRDKIMGALCIIGIVAAILLINLCGMEKQQIRDSIPDGITVTQGDGAIITMADINAPEYTFPSWRDRTLDEAQMFALFSIIAFVAAGPMLLFPKLMWHLDTLRYRIFHNFDTTPSYFAIVVRKAASYVLFALGVCSILYAYWMYL